MFGSWKLSCCVTVPSSTPTMSSQQDAATKFIMEARSLLALLFHSYWNDLVFNKNITSSWVHRESSKSSLRSAVTRYCRWPWPSESTPGSYQLGNEETWSRGQKFCSACLVCVHMCWVAQALVCFGVWVRVISVLIGVCISLCCVYCYMSLNGVFSLVCVLMYGSVHVLACMLVCIGVCCYVWVSVLVLYSSTHYTVCVDVCVWRLW